MTPSYIKSLVMRDNAPCDTPRSCASVVRAMGPYCAMARATRWVCGEPVNHWISVVCLLSSSDSADFCASVAYAVIAAPCLCAAAGARGYDLVLIASHLVSCIFFLNT